MYLLRGGKEKSRRTAELVNDCEVISWEISCI